MKFITKIKSYLTSGNERSVLAKKNIVWMFLIKGISIFIGLLLVPLTIHYVNTENYGIWITISSVVAWMSFFDIGLNNGLRNRFAEAKAKGEHALARQYVSTTYAMLCLIFIPLLIIFAVVNNFIDWDKVFNVNVIYAQELSVVLLIVVSYFCLRFILSTINIILTADQRPADASLRALCEQIVSLLIIFILTKTTQGSLTNLSIALCVAPILIIIVFNITLFKGRYKIYAPAFSHIKFSLLPNLFNLGVKFFIIQLAAIIQYQTSSIIIIRSWGAANVTDYHIAYKYFTILSMIMSIMITPVWSAVTEARTKGDNQWIIRTVNKYKKIFLIFAVGGIGMWLVSPYIYQLWLGKGTVNITYVLSFWMMIYVLTLMYGSIYVSVLNGIGALKIQFLSSIFSPFLFLCLCYIFINILNMGIYAVLIASIISNFNGIVLAPLQYYKIFNKYKKGIWIK